MGKDDMKTLLILRHAKSSWDNPDLADHERPLNKRGKNDAPRMGQLLREEHLLPDFVLSSDAVRTKETFSLVAKESGYRGEVSFSRDLYAAGPYAFIEALATLPESFHQVMVIGHNPGLEQLLAMLTGEVQPLTTAALAKVQLPIQTWAELSDRTRGELINIWRPKEL